MPESKPFNKLFGITGGLVLFTGVGLLAIFMMHAISGQSPVPSDGIAHYFIAFAGSAVVAWGVILLKAARDSALAATVALPTAMGFGLMSAYRIVVSFTEPEVYEWVGRLPAVEAVIFGVLALAFFRRSAS